MERDAYVIFTISFVLMIIGICAHKILPSKLPKTKILPEEMQTLIQTISKMDKQIDSTEDELRKCYVCTNYDILAELTSKKLIKHQVHKILYLHKLHLLEHKYKFKSQFPSVFESRHKLKTKKEIWIERLDRLKCCNTKNSDPIDVRKRMHYCSTRIKIIVVTDRYLVKFILTNYSKK